MFESIIRWKIWEDMNQPVGLHAYSLLILTGVFLSVYLASKRAPREGEHPETFFDLAFPLVIAGLLGSRFFYIIASWADEYAMDPWKVIRLWEGGLVFYGGPIGAAVYLFYFCWQRNIGFLKMVDLLVPYLAMAHAFGRLGCLMAGCCHGEPVKAGSQAMAWAIRYPKHALEPLYHFGHEHSSGVSGAYYHYAEQGYELSQLIHPTQLYESLFELFMFGFLLLLRNRKFVHGQIILTWMLCYAAFRYFVEGLRGDIGRNENIAAGFSFSQFISICSVNLAIFLLIYVVNMFFARKEFRKRIALAIEKTSDSNFSQTV